jgi:predicted nucleotidyltransferase
MPESDDEVRASALVLAESIAEFLEGRLGSDLLGFYLLGSLAHGGFNRRYSDIDVGLVAENGIDEDLNAEIKTEAQRLSPLLAPKLSIFWANRDFSIGRFPPLDRLDFLDHAVPLIERERVKIVRPTLTDVRNYLRGQPFENWVKATEIFAEMERLEAENHKPYLRAHLYPARFSFSWLTGTMASNDDAVDFLRINPPDGLKLDLIMRALDIRHAGADPDPLFEDRTTLRLQVAACAALMEKES